MREFCRSNDCDGQVDIPDDAVDSDIVECQKCGKRYEYKMDPYLIPIEPEQEK